MYVRLPKPLTEATISYKVKFSENYKWTAGGKLPGFCPERVLPFCEQMLGLLPFFSQP
jgi:hypothetical protein